MSVYPASKRVPGADLPRWEGGAPANLTAAATDALEWLRFFLPAWDPHGELPQDECPLWAAIEALERFSGAIYCPNGKLPERWSPVGAVPRAAVRNPEEDAA